MSTMLSPKLNQSLSAFLARRAVQHALATLALIALSVPICFHGLGDRALWSSHEGRAGQHAQLMLDTGHWGMPTLYFGDADYQKPPLYYWLVASVAWLRGGVVDEWSVRFPAAASAVLVVLLVYAIGLACWRRPASGLVAGLVVASNLRFSWLARVGRIDMPLTLAVAVVLGCFWMAIQKTAGFSGAERPRRGWAWMFLAYAAAALAVLLKGPVGVVLPLVVVVTFLVFERRPIWPWQRGWTGLMHRLGAWWGVPLTLAVAGPWFVWASVSTGGAFFKIFFLHHNWDRTLGAEGLKPEPFWYYAPQIFIDMFPWSVLAPAAAVSLLRHWRDGDRAAERFALAWSAAMFVFLSLVRFKRHDYLLPLIPGLALLVTGYWTRLDATAATTAWSWTRGLSWLMILCTGGAGIAGLFIRDEAAIARVLDNAWIREHVHETDRLVFSALLAAQHRIANVATFGGAALAVTGVCGLVAARRRRVVPAAFSFAAAWLVAVVLFVDCVLPPLEPLREQRSLATLARELRPTGATIYYYGREDQQLMFYLGPKTRWLAGREMFRPIIERTDPVFILVELDRLEQRQKDWPDVPMLTLARNVDNCFGTHRDPVVLITNESGERLGQSQRAKQPLAN